MEIDLDRLDRALEAFGPEVRVAVEPRHRSWFVPELCAVLRSHRSAFVLADRKGLITPLWTTADWFYLRMHQGLAQPRPCYGDDALRSWVARLGDLPGGVGGSGFVYFNNDHRACAIRNAVEFEELLGA
jgi:uncharacterized protein YecE (DUF72 family)